MKKEIRNFSVISHIDHGKSTLADRFLELTKTVDKKKMRPQYLDAMELERERGITIKMQPVRMNYTLNSIPYILNFIDTPGHVDFSYEVSRSLAAVEGAIILVDAGKGIQAQTLANLELAQKQNLVIVPVLNKIDLEIGIEETIKELSDLLKIKKEEILKISAKYNKGIEELLRVVIEKIPAPQGERTKPLRALIFDSKYDSYKGVIAYVRVIEGEIKGGEQIYLKATGIENKIKEVGYFEPELKTKEKLVAGEIGYIATGIKEIEKVRVGDTIIKAGLETEALAGYKEPKPVVFVSLYPEKADDFDLLKDGLIQLKLNDPSLTFEMESKAVLGRGFRCGFLGTLHAEIIIERLRREFDLNLVISLPSVVYKLIDLKDKEKLIFRASDFPDSSQVKEVQEPWVKLEIITPSNYFGKILELLKDFRGKQIEIKYLTLKKIVLIYEIPLREMIDKFYDQLKKTSQGFASLNYQIIGYREAKLIKLDILIAGEKEESLSKIVPIERVQLEGKKMVDKLKKIFPPQLFSVALQAAVSGRIIARQTVRPKRKDVTGHLYGGDYTRKRKLLEKQKKGKKKLKEIAKIRVPSKVFLEMLRG